MRRAVALVFVLFAACASPPRPAPVASAGSTCSSVEACAAEVSRDPTDPHLRVRWGRALEEAGRASAAAREFRAAIRLATDPVAAIDEAAEGLMRLGDAPGCVAELDVQLAGAHKVPALALALRRARERCAEAAKKVAPI